MWRQLFRLEVGVFMGLWLVFLLAGQRGLFKDGNSLWQIRIGEHILSTGQLITSDSFTCTHAGEPWIAYSWVAQCAVALVHRLAGLDGVVLGTATILAGLFTWFFIRLRREGMHELLALLITSLVLLCIAYHVHPRPHLFTIVFLAILVARLLDVEAGRRSITGLAWLFPLFVVWTNIHGGVLGGLATFGLVCGGWTLYWMMGKESPVKSAGQLIMLQALFALCCLAPFINPYGLELPRMWSRVIGSPMIAQYVSEHTPLLRTGQFAIIVLVIAAIYLAALAGISAHWPRVTWLVPLAWLALAFTRVRHSHLFAVTALLSLASAFPHVRWVHWLAEKGSVTFRLHPCQAQDSRPGAILVVPTFVVLIAMTVQVSGLRLPVIGLGRTRLDPDYWPIDLVAQLREHGNIRNGMPIFNDEKYGGFLLYAAPWARIFMDDRYELYGDEWFWDYLVARDQEPSMIECWQQRYRFEYALVDNGSGFDRYLAGSQGWTLVGRTKRAGLYKRKAGP